MSSSSLESSRNSSDSVLSSGSAGDLSRTEDSTMRVKLYRLNENRVWKHKGTGHVTFEHSDRHNRHNGMSLFVMSERNGAELLDSKIEYDTLYEIQEETIICWREHGTVDLALRFEGKDDCEKTWQKIYQLQRPPFGAIQSAHRVGLKETRDVDLLQPLSRWIKSYSGVFQPQDTNAIAELISLRKSALIDPNDNRESHLSMLCRYFDELSAMITKAPFILKPQVDFPFCWTTVFDQSESEFLTSNVGYEWASVLFNIAALESQIAGGQLWDRDSDLKACSKLYQQSAGIFNHLKEHVGSMLGQEVKSSLDLRPELHGAHCALMLAQGQEALYLDALINRKQPAVIAKLAQQAAEAVSEAYRQMNEQSFSKAKNMSAKSLRFEAIAYYHQSLHHHAAKEYGMQVAYLQRAVDLFSGNATSIKLYADDFLRVKTAYQAAKRDNDFIYHKCVPDPKSLPAIVKAPLAQILPFSPPLSEPGTFSGLFAHLVPAAFNHAVARFEYRLREAIESETESLRKAHASLLQQMTSELTNAIVLDSLNMPAAPNDVEAADGSYSSGLLEAVSRLRELLSQVETLKSDRDKLKAELKMQANNGCDQKSSFRRALTDVGLAKEEEITIELLENTFSAIREQAFESLEDQQRLIREIKLVHAEFVREGGASLLEQSSKSSHKDCLVRLERLNMESQQSDLRHFNDLADEDLLRIFKCMPPYDRLVVSEVCKRWNELSRKPWRDISSLDLTPIPGPSIGAIVKQCPNLKSIFAAGKLFNRSELCMLAQLPLASLRLYGCDCYLGNVPDDVEQWHWEFLPLLFAGSMPVADWEELALNEFGARTDAGWDVGARRGIYRYYVTGDVLPLSLKRLLLVAIHVRTSSGDPRHREPALSISNLFRNIGRLQNLTCLILISAKNGDTFTASLFARDLRRLQKLRELYLGYHHEDDSLPFTPVALGLPGLEVLFLNNYSFERPAAENGTIDLVPLITRHPALRILCIIGLQTGAVEGWNGFEEFRFVRRLYPNGFAAQPVPPLHVFLGKQAAAHIVFGRSPPEALQVHPITEPLPRFLEKEEIAQIFEGVWIAEQIKADHKNGTKNLYDENEGSADVAIRIMDDSN